MDTQQGVSRCEKIGFLFATSGLFLCQVVAVVAVVVEAGSGTHLLFDSSILSCSPAMAPGSGNVLKNFSRGEIAWKLDYVLRYHHGGAGYLVPKYPQDQALLILDEPSWSEAWFIAQSDCATQFSQVFEWPPTWTAAIAIKWQ